MTTNVLLPVAGIKFFRCPAHKDTLSNRWQRHFHTLYGINQFQYQNLTGTQKNALSVFDHPVTNLIHTPYWDITNNEQFRQFGHISQSKATAIFGLLDHLNLLQTLSVLLIALVTKMNNHSNAMIRTTNVLHDDNGQYLGILTDYGKSPLERIAGYLLKTLTLAIDLCLRLPVSFAASKSTHAFDLVKRLAAMVIATITAGASQLGAEVFYLAKDLAKQAPYSEAKTAAKLATNPTARRVASTLL